MQIVILAAGRGKRMGEFTDTLPKPMLEIKGKPILAHKIKALPKEIDEVILVVGYLRDQIERFFGNSYDGRKISYVIQERLTGTGGALPLAKEILKDDFLVMNGDDLYMKDDVERLIKNDSAMLVMEMDSPNQFGVVIVDEKGALVEVRERMNVEGLALVNTGLYKLNKKFFDYNLVSLGNGEFGLPQTLVKMTDKYIIKTEKAENWFPIGNPGDLAKAQKIIHRFI